MLKDILEKVEMGGFSTDEGYFAACLREGLEKKENVSVNKSRNPGEEHLVEGTFTMYDDDGKKKKVPFSINAFDVLGTKNW